MELFDSHCHLNDSAFDEDRDEVVRRAVSTGITHQLIPAIRADDWDKLLKTCSRYSGMLPALGIHPMFIHEHDESDLLRLEVLLAVKGKASAIGECGLDYFIKDPDKSRQKEFFEAQLSIAEKVNLPVVIHARRAEEEAILLVRKYPSVRGVFHGFSGSHEQARRLMELGYKLGFGGPLTYPRSTRLRKLFSRLPLDAILLETDAPCQPDAQWRGKRNEPARLAEILRELSTLRSEAAEQIAAATVANARKLFCQKDNNRIRQAQASP